MTEDLTEYYTTAQIHQRLGIPKPTIRNWSGEYAAFLSERAQPNEGNTRQFRYEDLIILNTVRHLTRDQGINDNNRVRKILAEGFRLAEFPESQPDGASEVLKDIQLVPVERLERALDRIVAAEDDAARVEEQLISTESQRDQALMIIDDLNTKIARLREIHGQLRGLLYTSVMANFALFFATVTSLIALILFIQEVQP